MKPTYIVFVYVSSIWMSVYISITLYHYDKVRKKTPKNSLTCYEKNKKLMDLLKKACKTFCDDLQLTEDDLYACLCSF